MARSREPFPVYRLSTGQVQPGNAQARTFTPNGVDGYTGPSYAERRGNTRVCNVAGTYKDVRRYGVAIGRGEWKR